MINKIFNTFSIKLVAAICNLLIAVIVSRYLGSYGKGEQSIVLTTISFILIFANIAGGATLVYLTPRFKINRLIFLSYSWSLLISLVFYLMLKLSNIVQNNFILHICLLSLINSFSSINSNILLGKERVTASNWVNFIQPLFTLIALFTFFVFIKKRDIYVYLYSLYFAYFISLVLSISFLNKKNDNNTIVFENWKATFLAMLSIGFLNQLSHITGILNARFSYYLLEKYKGANQLGIYSNGVSLSEAVWMVSGSMAIVQYARIANSADKKYAQLLTANLTKISLLISILIIIPMVLLPSGFYSFIFGKEFVNINFIMLCLAPGVLLWNISLIIGHYFSGTGKFYIEFTASSAGLLITLILSFWAIPRWGFYGAAIISSISYLFNSCVVLYFFKKESGMGLKKIIPQWVDVKMYLINIKNILNKTKV